MENFSIQQLIKIVRDNTDMSLISEKEFNDFIMSRRPLELLLMAQSYKNHNSIV
jgi:hypothetical protein